MPVTKPQPSPQGSSTVDCRECSKQFPTFKIYIKHLLAKDCPAGDKQTVPSDSKARKTDSKTETEVAKVSSSPSDKKVIASPPAAVSKAMEKINCNLCGKQYKNSRGLSRHIVSLHKCDHCDGNFPDVPTHISTVHETEQCSQCDQKFMTSDQLTKHIQKEHLVKCGICDDEFYSNEAVNGHKKEKHEEECNMCGARFQKETTELNNHLDKEHGIKAKTMKQFAGGMFMMLSD